MSSEPQRPERAGMECPMTMQHGTKARWVGPGVVIAPDGANLWASMMGELWKVSREQCRHATNDERMGIEAVITERQDLIEQFQRNPDRAAYKDITEEGSPEEERAEEEEPPLRRGVRFEPQAEEYEPTEYEPPEAEVQERQERGEGPSQNPSRRPIRRINPVEKHLPRDGQTQLEGRTKELRSRSRSSGKTSAPLPVR